MRRSSFAFAIGCLVASLGVLWPAAAAAEAEDLEAARRLFEANLRAIAARDREAYLGCYWQSERLVRSGAGGLALGFESHAAQARESPWPDAFDARDLELAWLRPGLVYGTYRYRVRYGADEHRGLSERLFLRTSEGWKIALTSAFEAPPEVPPPPLVLAGATLLDGRSEAPVADAVVIVRDGRIACAGSRETCPVPGEAEAVDASGTWIVPGLVDAHVHFSQTGWADGRPDALDLRHAYPYEVVAAGLRARPQRFFRSYLCSGVTAVFDVGGYPWTWELEGRAARDPLAPHVRAAGPLLSTLDHWVNVPGERQFLYLEHEAAARNYVRYHAASGSRFVKVWFLPVEGRSLDELRRLIRAVAEEAREAELKLIVHATELELARAAVEAGAHLLVHSVWDREVDEAFLQAAKARGTIYCPTLTAMDGYQRLFRSAVEGRPPAVDDPNGCVDAETLRRIGRTPELGAGRVSAESLAQREARLAPRRAIMAENLRRVHAAGIPVAMGTDAGNPLTLHGPSVYAEMEAMQAAGLAALVVLRAATQNAARAMDRLDAFGTIEAGKIADLLVVEADPAQDIANLRRLRYVMRGGELRHVRELAWLARAADGASP